MIGLKNVKYCWQSYDDYNNQMSKVIRQIAPRNLLTTHSLLSRVHVNQQISNRQNLFLNTPAYTKSKLETFQEKVKYEIRVTEDVVDPIMTAYVILSHFL